MKEKYLIDRELSWIKFNERVLEEAECVENPLIERLRFISIFQSNFDEFFRVRVGSAMDKLFVCDSEEDEKKYKKRLDDIFKATKKILPKLDAAFEQLLSDSKAYYTRVTPETVSVKEKGYLRRVFERELAPFLSPFIVEKKHPFPFMDNQNIIIGTTIKKKNSGNKFGFVPLRSAFPKAIFLPGEDCRFMLTEDVVCMFVNKVFHKFEVIEKSAFFIVRNSDLDESDGIYTYDKSFRDTMSKMVELRKRLEPVELKYDGENCEKLIAQLANVLFLTPKQCFKQKTPLSMGFLSQLEKRLPKSEYSEIYYQPIVPAFPSGIKPNLSVIEQIHKRDLLLSYPFEDVDVLLQLLDEAAKHPKVTEIMISLYRVASNSKIVHSLINAAKNGKKVTCLVELRARFDEANNIDWSKQLEEAGCKIIYGLPNYKVHCKLILISFSDRKPDIVHIGTGNFNESTAKLYTDLALLTANKAISADVRKVFDALQSGEFVQNADELMVAPLCLKSKLIEMIDGEIEKQRDGLNALIVLKFNSLTDKDLINKLIDASRAGVKIKMIVRGVCCLVPGVPDYTENIEIISIVGRLLEHSRIYAFGVGRECEYFISSADFMTRNTEQRVEVATPVYDYRAKQKLAEILRLCLCDNTKARCMTKQGNYRHVRRRANSAPHNMQLELFKSANKTADKS